MSALRERTQEINAEYWAARETQSERVAVAQLTIALARAEGATTMTVRRLAEAMTGLVFMDTASNLPVAQRILAALETPR
jgi:hypothetical protein